MDKVKIGSFIKEVSEKTTTNNQYILLTSSQSGIVSQQEYFNKQVASKDNTGYKIIKRGQFTYRAMSDTGCFYINRLSNYDVGIVSPAYPVFEITEKKTISGEFLQLFFKSNLFQSIIANKSTGSTRLSLKLNKIKDIDIAIPSLDEQKKIVSTMGFISDIISWRKKQIEQLDILLKSRFIEMFGDINVNSKQWPTAKMQDLCFGIGDGLHGTPIYTDNGEYPFVNGNNLIDGQITITESTKYVDKVEYDKYFIELNSNAILLSINGTLGKLAFYRNEKIILGKSACYFNLKPIINKFFIFSLMRTSSFAKYLEDNSSQSTIKNVGLKALRNYNCIVPPISLQNQFASFLQQVDKSKLAVQQSLDELETLKKSLMQQYFG